MLKIGDFSKLSYISIRMLRYYDKQNILKPSFTCEKTNYRFYKVEQLEIANMIMKLRKLGFANKIIKEIIKEKDLEKINYHFSKKIIELQDEIDTITKTQNELKRIIENNFSSNYYNVVKKTICKRRVLSLRRVIPSYMDENILWNELYKIINDNNIKVLNNCYPTAIYHDLEYKESDVDIEVQVSIDTHSHIDSDIVNIYNMPDLNVASITFNGSYEKMVDVTKSVMIWIESNNYQLVQPTFNIFHVSPAQDNNSNNWITESCFQIKERNE